MSLYTRAAQIGDSLFNFVSGLGTAKDPRTATQFVFNELNRTQLEQRYRSDWLARRIVDLPAEDATREWRQWTGDRAKLEKIDALEKKFDIQKKTRQALQRARLYGGSALVIGVDQGQPDEELELDDVGLNDLKFVVVVNRYELSAGPRIFNVDSPWYTRPEYYTVSTPMFGFFGEAGGAYPTGGNGTTTPFVMPSWMQGQAPKPPKAPGLPDKGRQVNEPNYGMIRMHPSRVIEFTGNELPDWRLAPLGGGWGDSVLQTVDDALRDFAMIVSGLASMINDMKMDVIKVPDLSRKLSTDDITRKTLERFGLANMAKSSINTLLLDKEEEWERIQTSFGSTPELIKVAMTLACAAGGVPETRIMGNAPNKGLASAGASGGEVDIRNYYDDIGSKQKSQYKPMMTPLDRCLQQSALGKYDPSIDYDWNPLYQPTALEQAQLALAKAQTTQVYVTTALFNEDMMRESVVSQLIEDKIYPGMEDALDEFGSEPEEPPAALQPVPPNAPPGMVPKGQFEANPFHMLRAQQAAKTGQPIRVPPNRKAGATQYEKVPPGAQGAQKPNGSKQPTRDDAEWIEDDEEIGDFNPYHDPDTGRFVSSESGRGNIHKAGVSAVEGALGGSRSGRSQRAMQQRQMTTASPGEAAAAAALHGGGDDEGVHAMALKLAPVHRDVAQFLSAPAVGHSITKVVGHFLAHHTAGITTEAVQHTIKTGVEAGLDYMITTVAAHAAAGGLAAVVPHFAIAVAAGYGVHILLSKAEKHGLNITNAQRLLGNALHYLADHYHALKRGVLGDAEDDPVLSAIMALLPHFPRADDGPDDGLKDFNPNHDPHTGQFSSGEGGDFLATSGMPDREVNYGLVPGDAAKFKTLKKEWAQVNNHYFENYMDTPRSPEAQVDVEKMKGLYREIYKLHVDPGGPAGVGKPGGPRDVTIVGAGPGGMQAAIFGGVEGLDTLLIEKSNVPGGQSRFSSRIENLSAWPGGVTGEKLSQDSFTQAQRVGADTRLGVEVTNLTYDPKTGLKHLTLSNGEHVASRTVILAGGVKFSQPTFPGAKGAGVIIGEPRMLAEQSVGQNAVIVGGSNGAAQAALGVAKGAKHVTLISRSPIAKGMSDYQVVAIENHPKITVIEGQTIGEVHRDEAGNVESVQTLKHKELIPTSTVGMFIGGLPDTDWLAGKVTRDADSGAVKTDVNFETKIPGVFAIGDMRIGGAKRVVGAMGDGANAIRFVYGHLEKMAKDPDLTKDAMPADAPADDGVMNDLIERWFAFDLENPWLGQTIEPKA